MSMHSTSHIFLTKESHSSHIQCIPNDPPPVRITEMMYNIRLYLTQYSCRPQCECLVQSDSKSLFS